jgi:hypothetical protein
VTDPDDTLPPSGHDTIPAPPPVVEESSHEPFCIVRRVTPTSRTLTPLTFALDAEALDED